MRNFKIAIPFLLFLLIGISCQKESVELKTDLDQRILEDWYFSTDEFVTWSDIYEQHTETVNRAKGIGGHAIRSATEAEADIVNQITSSKDMKEDLKSISKEIGKPDWSYLMAFETNSIHQDFQLLVPLMDQSKIAGVLTITLFNNEIIFRATKKNSFDHLVRENVDRDLILAQLQTVAAFNIFEKLTYEKLVPRYEYWYEDVFSEGFDQASNAKDFELLSSVWVSYNTYTAGEVPALVNREVHYSTKVDCPVPNTIEDPFGSGSIGASYWDVDIRDPRTTSTDLEPISLTTYVDLSEFKPLLLEDKIDASKALEYDNFKCLFEKFMEGDLSVFNDVIKPFESSSGLQLNFDHCTANGPYCSEKTVHNEDTGFITIYVDCENNPIDLAESILHEGIHAASMEYMCNYQNSCTNLSNTVDLLKLHNQYNTKVEADHIYIGRNYIENIGNVLSELDGNRFPASHYYGISFAGIESHLDANDPTDKKVIDKYKPLMVYNSEIISTSSLCQ